MKKWQDLIHENISEELKDKTQKRVGPYLALNENSRDFIRRDFFWWLAPATAAALGLLLYWRSFKENEEEVTAASFVDLADVEPIELLEDLDLLEELETLEDWEAVDG